MLYLRTALGNREVAERRHTLNRWQRAALIVVGQGKSLVELEHALRQLPEPLESILEMLIAQGLVTTDQPEKAPNAPLERSPHDQLKETRRYLSYLIGLVENTDAGAALGLTIALKKAATMTAMEQMLPVFFDKLSGIFGAVEAQRLLDKLGQTTEAVLQ